MLPGTGVPSTFGTGELNFCVRDGNRCGLSVKITGKLVNLLIKNFPFFENHTEYKTKPFLNKNLLTFKVKPSTY